MLFWAHRGAVRNNGLKLQREYKSVCVCTGVCFQVDALHHSDDSADITAVDMTAKRK